MSKETIFGADARERIKKGIDKAAQAVAPTLGVVGMSAIIEYPGLDPIECDDGVTILKNLEFKDKYEELGLQKIRKAALRTSVEGGDGTATTTVLTQALVAEAFKEIEQDSSKIREVRERLEKGLVEALSELSKLKREVTEEDIERIATISSLDSEVAKVIAEAIKEVGINGVITVEKGSQLGYSKEVVKGARFDKGLISPYFINDHESQSTVLNDPYIVLVDRKISMNEQIGATESQLKEGRGILGSIRPGEDILIIADMVDGVALATLAANAQAKAANIAVVCNPYTGSRAREFLFDMAALTGATVISEEMGMKLDNVTKDLFGKAEKVISNKDRTTMIGGKSSETLKIRIIGLQEEINNATSEYSKLILEERLAQLTGGIGVIRVGAYTDTEFNSKKYKFENAINATQAALQEGIVTGGGVAIAHIVKRVKEPMFKEALQAPFIQMAKNANVVDIDATTWPSEEYGVDFKTKEVVNMFEAGIIDPFKVVRLALESATAIAMSLVSIETAIITEDEPK